jgi:hypothetical protein
MTQTFNTQTLCDSMADAEIDAVILAALEESGVSAASTGIGQWRVVFEDISTAEANASRLPHWFVIDLTLASALSEAASLDPCRLLALNQQSGPLVKILPPSMANSHWRLRAELPLDGCDEAELARRIQSACRELRLLAQIRDCETIERTQLPGEPFADVALPELAVDCGWPCESRRDGARLVTNLECSRAPYQAIVERADGSEVLAWVKFASAFIDEIDGAPPMADVCRNAAAVLLMNVSSRIKMVRGAVGAVEESAGDARGPALPRLEVRLPASAGAADLSHAFSALSVACEVCGPEMGVLLSNPAIAQAFLARGWSPGASSHVG